jgi:hypothetical protein
MVDAMDRLRGLDRNIADSAHQLQRAAGHVQRHASGPSTVVALPAALAHLEEALERLATSAVMAAHAVDDWASEPGPGRDDAALSPKARALRRQLVHRSAHLHSARDCCPETRRSARELLRSPTANAGTDPDDSARPTGSTDGDRVPHGISGRLNAIRADADGPHALGLGRVTTPHGS